MKKGIVIFISIIVFILIMIGGAVAFYFSNITSVINGSNEVVVKIPVGANSQSISKILYENKLIKNEFAFKIYIRLNNRANFKAGTYKLDQGYDLNKITELLMKGSDYNPDEISITFVEGKNMRWLVNKLVETTNIKADDVYNLLKDQKYLKELSENYWFIGNDILNENIYYSLEGYLFPDTYLFKNKDVSVKEVFDSMLKRTEKVLEKYKSKILSNNQSIHKILTLASIVELESSSKSDRNGVAAVFLNRLKNNMSLGSDVTTYYGIKVDMAERDLKQSELNAKNGYNTRASGMEGKLPVSPIAMISESSIDAVMNPSEIDDLFFVADKNGKTYFSNTNAEHEQIIKDLKSKGLWFVYQ